MTTADSKLCRSCKEIKATTDFYKDNRSKDGLRSYCKKCLLKYNYRHSTKNKESKTEYMEKYRFKNKESLKEYSAKYRDKNKDAIRAKHTKYIVEYRAKNKAAIKERDSYYRAKNKESINAKNAEYRAKNKAAIKECRTKYYVKHKAKVMAYKRNRRAKKNFAPGSHTNKDILMLFELQRHRCAICKCSVKNGYHVDHIYPLASGGSNGKENLQILCPACNLSKSTKHPIQFMNQKGFLL